MKKFKVTVVFALFVFFLSNAVNAQEASKHERHRNSEMGEKLKMDKEKLALTKEQEVKFKEISMNYGQKMKDLKNTEGDRKSKFKQLRALRDAKDNDIKALLNPDQFKTYISIQEDRKANRKEHREEK